MQYAVATACLPLSLPRILRALVLACCAWLATLAHGAAPGGAPLELWDSARAINVWPAVTILEDAAGTLTPNQVLADMRGFAAPQVPHANLGPRRGAVWLRAEVEVPQSESGRWLLDVDYPSLDRVDLFVVSDGLIVRQVRLGDELRVGERPMPTRSHAVPLVLERGQGHVLLMRVETASTMILPLTLFQSEDYYEREASVQVLQALLAGVWLCLCVYSLTQWVSLRESMFGFYAMTIFGTGMFFISYFGLGPQHLWRSSAWLTSHAAPVAVLIGLVGGLLFVDRTLDVPAVSARAGLLVRLLAGCTALVLLLFVTGLLSYRATQTIATALGLSPMLVAVPVAFVRWRRGDAAARYMLWGWLIYAIGAAHHALLLRGMLPSTFWTQHAFQFGSIAEMVLWMMVLGARVDAIRTKAEAADRERDRLHSLAHTDALTGLLNRRGLQAAVEPLLRGARPQHATAIYLLDLDGFKPVNDSLGHDAGDQLLRQVGTRLQAQLRARDVVARLGGDEFVVAVAGLPGEAEAEAVGRKLLVAFQQPFDVLGTACRVGLTIGYAVAPLDGQDLQSLIKRADAAMYAGKQAGKNRVQRGAASAGLATG